MGRKETAVTDSGGRYTSQPLPLGTYRIEATLSGFKASAKGGIALTIDDIARVDFTLEVGTLQEVVEVAAQASLVDARTSSVGKLVDNRRIAELPLNTRNVYSLLFLTPGVAGTIGNAYGDLRYTINGARPRSSDTLIDGVTATFPTLTGGQGISVFPSWRRSKACARRRSPTTLTVPSALERQGDFSQTLAANGQLVRIFNPFSTRANPAGGFIRDQFADNKIPANMTDPAFEINGKTVVRAGYAHLYGPSCQQANGTVGPFGFRTENLWVASIDGITPFRLLRDPYPAGFVPSPGASQGLLTAAGGAIQAPLRNNSPTPWTRQWSVTLQRELPWRVAAEVSYVGTAGHDLQTNVEGGLNLNQLDPQYMALGSVLNQLVPNPFFGIVNQGILVTSTIGRAQSLRPYPQFTDVGLRSGSTRRPSPSRPRSPSAMPAPPSRCCARTTCATSISRSSSTSR